MQPFPTMRPEASDFQVIDSLDTQAQPNSIARLMFSFYQDSIRILNRIIDESNLKQISSLRSLYSGILDVNKENIYKNGDSGENQTIAGNPEIDNDIMGGEIFHQEEDKDDEDLNKEIRRLAILGKSHEARLFRERYRNNVRARGAYDRNKDAALENPTIMKGINAEIVGDISEDKRLFQTSTFLYPTTLPYAISDQFLTCIENNGWWEAMNSLGISRKGKHFIYTSNDGLPGHYSNLLGSARLLDVDEKEKRNLFKNDFFNDWEPELDRDGFEEVMEGYFSSRPISERAQLDYGLMPAKPNLVALMSGIINILGSEKIREIIRLCFDHKILIKNPEMFFDCMVKMAQELVVKESVPYSFAIVEGPVIVRLAKMKKINKRSSFAVLSKREILKANPAHNKGTTYQILIFNKNALEDGNEILSSIPEFRTHIQF